MTQPESECFACARQTDALLKLPERRLDLPQDSGATPEHWS
jgi:hypothetical protein